MKSVPAGQIEQPSLNLFKAICFYTAFGFFVSVLCAGRLVLIRNQVEATQLVQPLFLDLFFALFVALFARLLLKLHLAAAAVFLAFLSLFHIASLEMAVEQA